MSISIDNVSKVSGIAIAITAIVAVVTFSCSVIDHQEERRNDRISSWRKVAIHEAFQGSQSNELKISEIQSKLKTQAWDASVDIRKEELSRVEIRELLLEMIASGIVEQNKDDRYNLRFAPSKEVNTIVAKVAEDFAIDYEKGAEFRIKLQEKLTTVPFEFSMEKIFEDVAKPLGFDRIQYNLVMKFFQDLGQIKIKEDKDRTVTLSIHSKTD